LIRQGDIVLVDFGKTVGSESAYRHPAVVVQATHINRTRINTVIVCLITSNLKRGDAEGNVRLAKGEANFAKPSVANVSQVFAIDKSMLAKHVGSLSPRRVREVIGGIAILLEPDA
jgi:mRNA interferase MazF